MISTPFTRRFDLRFPIVSAPMGGVAGGHLAATVSNAGALGMIGGGYGDLHWVEKQLNLVSASTDRAWGIGFISWSLKPEVLQLALQFKPAAVILSFGSLQPWAAQIKESGAALGCQVQDLQTARQAIDAGADFLVAQGAEAGGHGGTLATMPLVPSIVDLASGIPVLAAGGIADGRGVAAAVCLGAQGAMLGTRFYASEEALGHQDLKQELVRCDASDTVKTQVFDVLREYAWPESFTGRAIQNDFVRRWHSHTSELASRAAALMPAFTQAQSSGDTSRAMVWAGECVSLVNGIESADALVRRIGADAEAVLADATGASSTGPTYRR
ncbi:nitronate monooxygenase [Sinimarinibacterium sp. CAU 1509]|uniref:NAD(P)H-dependent flavin oxidoreductase n=1 Tax=Sinimarinibacterium sp. CAU 1509 TaxID=2562283 RepID=UPI0010AB6201|nr:nitronate monooxygenase [Sinimarinibacterium sp. CAU 1509]TJY55413.1 nitronate monooxygenase [Sinimarinibacterium sp. CAU 1509]